MSQNNFSISQSPSSRRRSAPGSRALRLTLCALFTALISAGAFIKIPVPVVPFTLQFLFTTLAGLLLGGKDGAACVGAYLLLGLMGLPVFAEGGGIWYIGKPSFGYLIGFCLASFVTGTMAGRLKRPSFFRVLLCCLAGLSIVYLLGMAYFYLVSNYIIHAPIGLWPLFLYCFLLAVPGDIALCFLASALFLRAAQAIPGYHPPRGPSGSGRQSSKTENGRP